MRKALKGTYTSDDDYTVWSHGRMPKKLGTFYTVQLARQWFERQSQHKIVRVWVRNQYGDEIDLGCFEKEPSGLGVEG